MLNLFLLNALSQADPRQVPLGGGRGTGGVTPMLQQTKPRYQRQRQHPATMSRCPSTPPRPPGGRQTERDSFVNDDHAPFNRVWNWFCCLAFWSNYSKLAKFTHLHDLWVLCTSIYMASKQSINFNGILVMTSPFGAQQNFPQLYTWWYSPKRQNFPKTVCYLK